MFQRISDFVSHAVKLARTANPPMEAGPLAGRSIAVPPGGDVHVTRGASGEPWTVEWTDESGATHLGTLNPGESVTIVQEDGSETTITASDAIPVPPTSSTTTTTTTTVAPAPAEKDGVYVASDGRVATLTESADGADSTMELTSGTLPDRPADRPVTITFSTLPDRPQS